MTQKKSILTVISNNNPIIESDVTDCSDPNCGICHWQVGNYNVKMDYASHKKKIEKSLFGLLELSIRGS